MLGRARERLGDDERVHFVGAEASAGLESLERAVERLSPRGLIFFFDFTCAFDITQMDEFHRELEPERWPICRALTVDFPDGIAEGRYRVYSEPDVPRHQASFARSRTA
jgi:hypothetical protein